MSNNIYVVAFEARDSERSGGGFQWYHDRTRADEVFHEVNDGDSDVYLFQWNTDMPLNTPDDQYALTESLGSLFRDPSAIAGLAIRKSVAPSIVANYDNPFPTLTVKNGDGADWDTFMSFISLPTDVAYEVGLFSTESFLGKLVDYERVDPFTAEFRVWNAAEGDYTDPLRVSLTEVKTLAVV